MASEYKKIIDNANNDHGRKISPQLKQRMEQLLLGNKRKRDDLASELSVMTLDVGVESLCDALEAEKEKYGELVQQSVKDKDVFEKTLAASRKESDEWEECAMAEIDKVCDLEVKVQKQMDQIREFHDGNNDGLMIGLKKEMAAIDAEMESTRTFIKWVESNEDATDKDFKAREDAYERYSMHVRSKEIVKKKMDEVLYTGTEDLVVLRLQDRVQEMRREIDQNQLELEGGMITAQQIVTDALGCKADAKTLREVVEALKRLYVTRFGKTPVACDDTRLKNDVLLPKSCKEWAVKAVLCMRQKKSYVVSDICHDDLPGIDV
jgi:hypothetical protein